MKQGGGIKGRRALAGLVLAVGLVLGGCGAGGLMPGLTSQAGGLPERNAASISEKVEQARKGRLDAAGGKIPYTQRKLDEKAGPRTFLLALEGKGRTQQGRDLTVRVELDKGSYSDGQVLLEGGSKEVWPIVASDRRGTLEDFDIIYVLAQPGKGYRYLQLIGGDYSTEEGDFYGITGMLIDPAAGSDARQLDAIATVNFGHAFPETPVYEQQIDEVGDLLRTLRSRARTLLGLQADIQAREKQIADLKAQPIPPGGAQARQDQTNVLEVDLGTLRTKHKTLAAELDASWVELFAIRRKIEEAYAAFVGTNHYTWFPQKEQEARFRTWERTDGLDRDIEAAFASYIPASADRTTLEAERKKTLDTITRVDNKARNPKSAP